MKSTHDVLHEIRAIFGELPYPGRSVVHVVSCVRMPSGRRHVLAIGPCAPKSDTDFFALQLARARADAVVTTAQILRAEPDLTLALEGVWAAALREYRTSHLGKHRPLLCALLTRSGDVPSAHPLFRDPTHKLVLTAPEAAPELSRKLGARATVLSDAEPSARGLIELLRRHGAETVSIEAGPSTVRELYVAPATIDELWLSTAEMALPQAAVGKALPEDALLFAGLSRVSDVVRVERSGPWRFQRFIRS